LNGRWGLVHPCSGEHQLNGGAGVNQMYGGTETTTFYAVNRTGDEIFAGSATNETLFYSASDNPITESGIIPPANKTLGA
jgi:hypothetical protein